MPRYELDEAVWEIAQSGKELALVVDGKATTRRFVSPDHAAVQYAKLIAEREAAGWKLVAGAAPVGVTHLDELREPGLEQRIIENLDDRDAYSVYADWYQARQHPRGELIALQLAEEARGEDRKLHDAVEKHLVRYKTELLGPLAKYELVRDSPFIWRNGFIQGLFFSGNDRPAEMIREVLGHPSGRLVTSIELQIHDEHAIQDALIALAPAAPTLRDVYIMTGATLAGLEFLERLPQLRTVSLATLALDSIRGRDLRSLSKISNTCVGLHLRFDGSGTSYLRDLLPLFERDDLRIAKLSMRVPMYIDPILTAIAEGPFAPHLEKLDIALTDPDSGMRVFLEHRERFVKLREVAVSLRRLTVTARNALQAHYKVNDVTEDGLADQIGYEDDHFDGVQE